MPPKTLSSLEAADRKRIDIGLNSIKQYIKDRQYDQCIRIFSSIIPPIKRLHYHEYEVNVLQTLFYMKTKDFVKAKECCNNALSLKPDDPTSWRALIEIEANPENPGPKDLLSAVQHTFENSRPDKTLLTVIAPHLKELDNPTITHFFINSLINCDAYTLPVVNYIPETPDTLEIRLKMLKLLAPTDINSCSTLIHFILEETQNPFDAIEYSKMLPEDHVDRILVETLLGDNPIENAKKHISTGSEKFSNFVKAANSKDSKLMRNQIALIEPFPAGWIYLCENETDTKSRLLYLKEGIQKYPQLLRLRLILVNTYDELGQGPQAISASNDIKMIDAKIGLTMYVQHLIKYGYIKEAQEALSKVDIANDLQLSPKDKAIIDLEFYRKSGNKELLQPILDSQDPTLAIIAAEAAFELRKDLGDKVQQYFVNALKIDKESVTVLICFGKWLLEQSEDEDKRRKGFYLLSKAIDYGNKDPEICKIISEYDIKNNNFEHALEVCSKISTNWSHFRAGLILQRLQKYDEAIEEFQQNIKFNPTHQETWSALGFSYLALGRIKAAQSVVEKLVELKHPDRELEYQLNVICNQSFNMFSFSLQDFMNEIGIENSPIPAISIITQSTALLNRFHRFGRKETCLDIIQKVHPLLPLLSQKWDLATVYKSCLDFDLIAFSISGDSEIGKEAIQFCKRRAEKEKRAESFIDLARSLSLIGRNDQAEIVLRKVIKVFSTHAGLWTNLGIAFAKNGKLSFARHCFCVSSKLATNIEACRAYACCAAVAIQLEDDKLKKISLQSARQCNALDSDVWQIEACDHSLDSALSAFENGAPSTIISALPSLCIEEKKLFEALGFAFISRNKLSISRAYEALGKYDFALQYAEDPEDKKRLAFLSNQNTVDFPNKGISLFKSKQYDEAEQEFKKMGGIDGALAFAACEFEKHEISQALKVLQATSSKATLHADFIDKLALQYCINAPHGFAIKSHCTETDPELFFLDLLQTMDPLDSAEKTRVKFINNPKALKLFVVENLKQIKPGCRLQETVEKAAEALVQTTPSSENLGLLIAVHLRQEKYKIALTELERLCVLQPKIVNSALPIITYLKSQ